MVMKWVWLVRHHHLEAVLGGLPPCAASGWSVSACGSRASVAAGAGAR